MPFFHGGAKSILVASSDKTSIEIPEVNLRLAKKLVGSGL